MAKENDSFLNLSIAIAGFKDWYLSRHIINAKTHFVIIERKTGNFICGFGTENEIRFFLRGYKYAAHKATEILNAKNTATW